MDSYCTSSKCSDNFSHINIAAKQSLVKYSSVSKSWLYVKYFSFTKALVLLGLVMYAMYAMYVMLCMLCTHPSGTEDVV